MVRVDRGKKKKGIKQERVSIASSVQMQTETQNYDSQNTRLILLT